MLVSRAGEGLAEVIGRTGFRDSVIPVIANVTVRPVDGAEAIGGLLVQQMSEGIGTADGLTRDGIDGSGALGVVATVHKGAHGSSDLSSDHVRVHEPEAHAEHAHIEQKADLPDSEPETLVQDHGDDIEAARGAERTQGRADASAEQGPRGNGLEGFPGPRGGNHSP